MITVLHDMMTSKDWPQSAEIGQTNVNIGLLQGGQAVNATAAKCTAKLLIRIVSDVEEVKEVVTKIVHDRVKVEFGVSNDAVKLFTPNTIPADKTTIVAFNTDIAYFHSPLTKNILFGPGSITDAHSDWEYVKEADMHKACIVYEQLVAELLNE